MKRHTGIAAVTMMLIAACIAMPSGAPAPTPADYAAVIADAARSPQDKARDAARKPADILAFAQIAPGQTVFDMEAGAGYYTELFSRAVGPTGRVVMQMPKEFQVFYNEPTTARLKDNRLPNVTQSLSMFDKLDAADASVDVVTWFQGPHELYCLKECGNLPLGKPAAVFAEIWRILKPGGHLVILDHSAAPGAPVSSGNDLHRIDRAHIKSVLADANFTLAAESDILANPADDRERNVFDPAIQGKTDQFLLRYKKS